MSVNYGYFVMRWKIKFSIMQKMEQIGKRRKLRRKTEKVESGCNADKMGFCLHFIRFGYMIL